MFKNILFAILILFVCNSTFAQSVVFLRTGDPSVYHATVTVAAGGLETMDLPLAMLGDAEDANLLVEATSSAAVTADVLGASSSDGSDNSWIAAAAALIQFSGAASGSVDQANLKDLSPFVRLSFDNNGAAEVVFDVSFVGVGAWAEQWQGRTPVLPQRYIMAQETVSLPATTGSDITDYIDVKGKSRLLLFIEPSATGLVFDVLESQVSGGPEYEVASDTAVGANDVRLATSLDNGARLARLRLQNPTAGAITATYSVVAVP